MKNDIEKFDKVVISGSLVDWGDELIPLFTFLAWAAAYDCGDISMRSKAKHNEWQKILKCKQIILDGSVDRLIFFVIC